MASFSDGAFATTAFSSSAFDFGVAPTPAATATVDHGAGSGGRKKPKEWKQDPALQFEIARYLLQTEDGPEVVEASPERLAEVIEERGVEVEQVRVIPEYLFSKMPPLIIGRSTSLDADLVKELRAASLALREYEKRIIEEREDEELAAQFLLLH